MTYDYYIVARPHDGFRVVEDADLCLVTMFYTPAAEAIFIAGASALGLSVYDNDAGHGLCGTLEQTMNEGTAA